MKFVLVIIVVALIISGTFWALGIGFQDVLSAYAAAQSGGGHFH